MDDGLPWIMRLKCELPTRELRANGTEYPVKASFVAFGAGGMMGTSKTDGIPIPDANTHPQYAEFVSAMEKIDIYDVRAINSPVRPGAELRWGDKNHLEQSDVICVSVAEGANVYQVQRPNPNPMPSLTHMYVRPGTSSKNHMSQNRSDGVITTVPVS